MNSALLEELITKYRENKLAHAYLIETNNLTAALEDLKEVIKNLNCPHTYQTNCHDCNLCNLINLSNLPSLKIIEPDGPFIKKNQIEELKSDFASIPLYSRYNIYILKNAEKLNSSSANAMLKFVEEPTPGIIGFFLTTNKDIMIDTIKSRCQSYTLNYPVNTLQESLNLDDETYHSYLDFVKNYLDYIFSSNIINHKNIFLNQYSDRHDIEIIFKLILAIYHEHFLKLTNKSYQSDIINIYPLTANIPEIIKKMQIISQFLTNLRYNVSVELILDKFVLEMRGNYE